MADDRNFPDVDFVETDTEQILNSLQESYEAELGRTLYPADPVKQLILWLASVISQERSYMNIAAKRNLPRYATGDYLDSLTEIFYGITRQEAKAATCTLKFTLSTVLAEDLTVPAGTEVTADGVITFATDEALTIAAGEISGSVAATCTTTGTGGNGFPAGTVATLVQQIAYIAGAENTDATTGGTDRETDSELYARARESYEGYSTAGTAGAYRYLALKHNEAVSDVVVTEGEPGETIVTILMNTGLPSAEELADMQEYLSGDDVRPVTDHVTVQAPTAVTFDVNVTYYGAARPAVGGKELSELVEEAANAYLQWQTGVLGRRINPGQLMYQLISAGAIRAEITSPAETELTDTQCAVFSGNLLLTYGGEE